MFQDKRLLCLLALLSAAPGKRLCTQMSAPIGAVYGRVLIFLEAEASGRQVPDFAVHLLGDLLHAAEDLGCRSLQVCACTLAGVPT